MLKGSLKLLLTLVSTTFLLLACGGGASVGGLDPLDNKWAGGGPTGPTYTVTYMANGPGDSNFQSATVPIDPNAYAQNQTVTVLPMGTFVFPGELFGSWNTVANGSGTTYAPGATFPMGAADVILYAQWVPATYTVTYYGNTSDSGTPPVDSNVYYWQGYVTVLGNTGGLVKASNTFVGWNTAPDGSGTTYIVGTAFYISGSMSLYAIWTTGPTYTITYALNGGTGTVPVDNNQYMPGQTVHVQPGTFLQGPGYTPFFSFWATQSNGGGIGYLEAPTYLQSFVMGNADVTLYAIYYGG